VSDPTPNPAPAPVPAVDWGSGNKFFRSLGTWAVSFGEVRVGGAARSTFGVIWAVLAWLLNRIHWVILLWAACYYLLSVGAVQLPLPVWPWPTPAPSPSDPFAASLKAAYAKDTDADRAKSLAFLQGIYPAMAAGFPSPPPVNNAAMLAWMKSKVEAPGVGLSATQLVNLRKAISAELVVAFGTDPAALVNVTTYPAELRKIGTALNSVK
jgi:hypothetical protein